MQDIFIFEQRGFDSEGRVAGSHKPTGFVPKFYEELKARGIGASVHFIPLHVHPYYRDTYGHKPDDFPVALDAFRRSISLPIYSKMTDADIERVIAAVSDAIETHRR